MLTTGPTQAQKINHLLHIRSAIDASVQTPILVIIHALMPYSDLGACIKADTRIKIITITVALISKVPGTVVLPAPVLHNINY